MMNQGVHDESTACVCGGASAGTNGGSSHHAVNRRSNTKRHGRGAQARRGPMMKRGLRVCPGFREGVQDEVQEVRGSGGLAGTSRCTRRTPTHSPDPYMRPAYMDQYTPPAYMDQYTDQLGFSERGSG